MAHATHPDVHVTAHETGFRIDHAPHARARVEKKKALAARPETMADLIAQVEYLTTLTEAIARALGIVTE